MKKTVGYVITALGWEDERVYVNVIEASHTSYNFAKTQQNATRFLTFEEAQRFLNGLYQDNGEKIVRLVRL